jgi:hypothetical protein
MSDLTEAQWIDKFLSSLGPRLPDMRLAEATEWAQLMYAEASDLDPYEAAEIFALELPPRDAGTAGDP